MLQVIFNEQATVPCFSIKFARLDLFLTAKKLIVSLRLHQSKDWKNMIYIKKEKKNFQLILMRSLNIYGIVTFATS